MTMRNIESTGTWKDLLEAPESLTRTIEADVGFDEVASMVSRADTRRLIVTGNGASYYLAQGLWLLALAYPVETCEVVAVPAGLLAIRTLTLRQGDMILAVSASGELRDLVEWSEPRGLGIPFATVTGNPSANLGERSEACAVTQILAQRGATHTQAFMAAWAALLIIWARVSGEAALELHVQEAPRIASEALEGAPGVLSQLADVPTPRAAYALGSGLGWAAAGQCSLLMKELASLPCEGLETREAATLAISAIHPGDLVLNVANSIDNLALEAVKACTQRGARVLDLNFLEDGINATHPLLPIAVFPYAAAVALGLGLRTRSAAQLDQPDWWDIYETVARSRNS